MLMALNPEKQCIAQAEIDGVTEGQRLPNFADREHLPYVAALAKEVMRWHAVVPLGEYQSHTPTFQLIYTRTSLNV